MQTPENLEQRRRWDDEHQITDPAVHAVTRQELGRLSDRAREMANIAAVVTIRTRPKR